MIHGMYIYQENTLDQRLNRECVQICMGYFEFFHDDICVTLVPHPVDIELSA